MFLDEKLYNHVKNSSHVDGEEFTKMLSELYTLCEEHYKPCVKVGVDRKIVKAAIDRTFNAWNLMLAKLKKDDYPFTFLLEEYSVKNVFFMNDKLKSTYSTL